VPRWLLSTLGAALDADLATEHRILPPIHLDSDDSGAFLDAVLARADAHGEDARRAWWLGVSAAELRAPGRGRVFGEAAVGSGCAVVGLGALDAASASGKTSLQERALKVCLHELGHAAGLEHCADPVCVMYPARDIADVDRKDKLFCRRCAGDASHATLDAARG